MDENKVLIDEQNLYDIADAIRRKNGETVKYLPDEMPPAMDAIPTGSVTSLAGNLAVAYEGLTFPVVIGTHCIYDDMYYVSVAPIESSEPFTPSHWQRITAGVEIEAIKHYIHDMSPIATIDPMPVVSVSDAAPLDAEGLVVGIEPVQEGAGDPSPDNVRPITGWTGANVFVNGNVISVTFPSEAGTVYGGTLDVVNGELVVDRAMVDLGTLTWNRLTNPASSLSNTYLFNARIADNGSANVPKIGFSAILSTYKWVNNYIYFNEDKVAGYIYNVNIAIRDDAYTDATTFKSAMSGVQLVYELATPITYQLTPQEISLMRGNNTIYADCGDTTLTYRQDVGLLLQSLTVAIRNISP